MEENRLNNSENKENKKRNISNNLIFGFVILTFLNAILIKWDINGIEWKLDNIYDSVEYSDNVDDLYARIDDLEEKIDKQTSIIDEYSIEYADINADNLIGAIEVAVTPKEYKSSDVVSVIAGEHKVQLKLVDGRFVGTLKYPISEVHTKIQVTIDSEGVVSSETIDLNDSEYYSASWREELEFVICRVNKGSALVNGKNNKLSIDSDDMQISIDNKNEKCADLPVLCVVKNDELVSQIDMKFDSEEKVYTIDKKYEVAVEDGDKVEIYFEYAGKSGLKYRLYDYELICEEGDFSENYLDDYKVYDRNGNEVKFTDMD